MDIRTRMVALGLALGVLVAIFFSQQGCGDNHPRKRGNAAGLVLLR